MNRRWIVDMWLHRLLLVRLVLRLYQLWILWMQTTTCNQFDYSPPVFLHRNTRILSATELEHETTIANKDDELGSLPLFHA